MPYTIVHPMHPGLGFIGILVLWLVQLVIAYVIYRDAKEQNMSALLWGILAIIPLFGYLPAVLYAIIRDVRSSRGKEKTPMDILRERFAEGQLSEEEFENKKKILLN
jgi:putative membrane protein